MSYLEAAWDGSVEGVSDALRAGVHADTTSLVRDFGTLGTPLVLHMHITQGQHFSNNHNFNSPSYIMSAKCKTTSIVLYWI